MIGMNDVFNLRMVCKKKSRVFAIVITFIIPVSLDVFLFFCRVFRFLSFFVTVWTLIKR